MSATPVVAAIGVVDPEGIRGSAGIHRTWRELGVPAPGDGRTFRAVFGRGDETFRRLDVASRTLVLACEAAGLDRVLLPERRAGTALVIETTIGCLDADLQFAASMRAEMCDAPIFPYTLPSTCLGEVALRHGLRGISVCLAVAPGERGEALAEAVRLLASGEATAVVAGTVDVLERETAAAERACAATVVLLADPRLGLPPVAPWPGSGSRAFDALHGAV